MPTPKKVTLVLDINLGWLILDKTPAKKHLKIACKPGDPVDKVYAHSEVERKKLYLRHENP